MTNSRRKVASAADPEASRWLAALRAHARTGHLTKAAAPGSGAEGEIPFEQAFSNLAHSHMRSRAPVLLDYELGFQLLDKDDDNTRAVGIFGFQVGPQLFYAPVFFVNGEIKGYELLYLKDSDTFVPLRENWINYLLARKPMVIGRPAGRMGTTGRPSSDLSPYYDPPSKYAADRDWANAGVSAFAYAAGLGGSRPAYEPQAINLVKESSAAAMRLVSLVSQNPKLAAPIETALPGLLKAALESAKRYGQAGTLRPKRRAIGGSIYKSEKRAAEDDPRVTVHVYDGEAVPGLNQADREALLKQGMLVKDAREDHEVSRVYPEKLPSFTHSPDRTGVWKTFTVGGLEDCLILHHPHGAAGRIPGVAMIRTGESKTWAVAHESEVVVTGDSDAAAYESLWNGLSEASSLDRGETYVLLGEKGESVGPFEVLSSQPAPGGAKGYKVYWRNGTRGHKALQRQDYRPQMEAPGYGMTLLYVGQPGTAKVHGHASTGLMTVPPGFKAMKVKAVDCCDTASDESPLIPATRFELELAFREKTAELVLRRDGSDVLVGGEALSPKRAAQRLIVGYGLREKAARDLVDAAVRGGKVLCRVKYAEGYYPSFPMPPEASGQDPLGGNIPTQESGVWSEYAQTAAGPQPGIDQIRPDAELAHHVGQAAATGQKEVLDASMFSGLLRSTKDESVIDRNLGPLMRALDATGRLIFNLYWHPNVFEDRYGESELPEIEDGLRNLFEQTGDVVLDLKRKDVDPFGVQTDDIDLGVGEGGN